MSVHICARRTPGSCLRSLAVLLTSASLLFASFAFGQTAESAAGNETANTLTLPEALARVLRESPELSVFPYQARAAEARALQAGLRPNPVLSVEVEDVGGSGEFSGTDAVETTLALSQVIEMGGKRRFRRQVGELQRDVLERDYELARLDVLARAASQFLEVATAQRLLAFSEQVAEWTDQAEDAAQARFQAGSISRAELARVRTDAMRAVLTVRDRQSHLQIARLRLASLWGDTEPDFGEVTAELFKLAELPLFARIREEFEAIPQLERYLTLERLRQAELELAIARGRRDIEVGLGVTEYSGTGDNAFSLQFSMPLGLSSRNQGEIAAARANLAQFDVERNITRISVLTELQNAFEQMRQARTRVQVLRDEIHPEAEQALDSIQAGYGDGRFSYTELVQARQQVLAIENDAIEAANQFHQMLITLEKLTGQPLTVDARSMLPSSVNLRVPLNPRVPDIDGADDGANQEQENSR